MTNTMLWGSCVSRDTFERLPDRYEILGYVARQSLCSAGRPVREVPPSGCPSAFQRRMADGDVRGDAIDRIEEVSSRIDLLLMDLCDERLGIVDLGERGVLTRSVERIAADEQGVLDARGRVLTFGSDDHFDAWKPAALRCIRELTRLGVLQRTVLLAPAWALVDEEAEATPSSFGVSASEHNAALGRYVGVFADAGVRVVGVDVTLADSQHQWGPAPFHYHSVSYDELVAGIEETVGQWASKSGRRSP